MANEIFNLQGDMVDYEAIPHANYRVVCDVRGGGGRVLSVSAKNRSDACQQVHSAGYGFIHYCHIWGVYRNIARVEEDI